MGLHQTKKLLHRKGNHPWNKQDNTQNGIKYLQRYNPIKGQYSKYIKTHTTQKKKKIKQPK